MKKQLQNLSVPTGTKSVSVVKRTPKSKQGRRRYTEEQNRELLDEVGGFCPLCGWPLVEKKNKKRLPQYARAHIYPHSPTDKQQELLKDVPKPDDVESLENIILICRRCHERQDCNTTLEDYMHLYTLKQNLMAKYRTAQESARVDVEPELKTILARLASVKDADLAELSFHPLAVKRKIEDTMLQRRVLDLVTTYYGTLRNIFQEFDNGRSSTFEKIASQFRLAFLKQEVEEPSLLRDQERVFDGLTEWVRTKTGGKRLACEAVVSFFIQDCEVFREISRKSDVI